MVKARVFWHSWISSFQLQHLSEISKSPCHIYIVICPFNEISGTQIVGGKSDSCSQGANPPPFDSASPLMVPLPISLQHRYQALLLISKSPQEKAQSSCCYSKCVESKEFRARGGKTGEGSLPLTEMEAYTGKRSIPKCHGPPPKGFSVIRIHEIIGLEASWKLRSSAQPLT